MAVRCSMATFSFQSRLRSILPSDPAADEQPQDVPGPEREWLQPGDAAQEHERF